MGCSGWSYDAWLGHFYPVNLDRKEKKKKRKRGRLANLQDILAADFRLLVLHRISDRIGIVQE
jgi:hypothetical protein